MSDMSRKPQARAVGALILSVIAAFPLFLGLLLGSVYFYTVNKPFYLYEYEKYDNASVIGVSDETLDEITDVLIDYIKGTRDNMDIKAERNGEYQEIYSQRAKDHMVDVLFLFDLLRIALKACVIVFLLLLAGVIVLCAKKSHTYASAKMLMLSLIGLVVLFLALALVVASNFNAAFIKFHHIFFTNDLWLLPGDDVLVNMVPTGFFMDICLAIALTFAGALGLCIIICLVVMSRTKRYLNKSKHRTTAEEIFDNMGIHDESMVPENVRELYTDTRVLQMAIEEQKQIDAQLNEPSTQDFDEMEPKSIQPPEEDISIRLNEQDMEEETVQVPENVSEPEHNLTKTDVSEIGENTVLLRDDQTVILEEAKAKEEETDYSESEENKLRERLRRFK